MASRERKILFYDVRHGIPVRYVSQQPDSGGVLTWHNEHGEQSFRYGDDGQPVSLSIYGFHGPPPPAIKPHTKREQK